MLPPEIRLYVDSVTHYSRTLTRGTRGDGKFANGTGTLFPNAIVTMRTDFSLRDEGGFGQPVEHSNWDVKIRNASDPLVVPDDTLVDQNGRTFQAISKSTARGPSDWIVHCKSND